MSEIKYPDARGNSDNMTTEQLNSALQSCNKMIEVDLGNVNIMTNANRWTEDESRLSFYNLRRLIVRYMNTRYDPSMEDGL